MKILIYGDVDLNIIDGSSIWLTAIANLFDLENDVYVLLKSKIRRQVVIKNIKSNIRLIHNEDNQRYRVSEARAKIIELDKIHQFDYILLRGAKLNHQFMNHPILSKVITYVTDLDTLSHEELKGLFMKTKYIIAQTHAYKNYIVNRYSLNEKKVIEIPPLLDQNKTNDEISKQDNQKILYAGKIAFDWQVKELVDLGIIHQYPITIIGDKFQKDMEFYKKEFIQQLDQYPNINWLRGLTRKGVYNQIKSSHLGYCFRTKKIDHDDSLEISSKLIEYASCGVPVILRRTKFHEHYLGEEYAYYANSIEEVKEKIDKSFDDKKTYQKTSKDLKTFSHQFSIENVNKKIKKYFK